jgi:cyanophycin synthetase
MAPSPSGLRLRVALARVTRKLRAGWPGARTVYVSDRVAEYRTYWSDAAALLGATFEELTPSIWEVRQGERRTRLVNFVTQCDDPVILHLAGNKPLGYALAARTRVPAPEHRVVSLASVSIAERFLLEGTAPLVVKPASRTSSGLGVTTGVRTRGALRAALALASLYDRRILVERMIPGESYRLLYLGGRFLHAVRRRGLRVTGDGRLSVRQLLAAAGIVSPEHDTLIRETLAAQGVTSETVPASGSVVLVRGLPPAARTRELRTVYDETVTDRCGTDLIEEGLRVVRSLGSEFAGVDIITTNPATSLRESGGAFIEINTTPGIHHHYVAGDHRTPTPVAVTVLEYLLARRQALVAAAPPVAMATEGHSSEPT